MDRFAVQVFSILLLFNYCIRITCSVSDNDTTTENKRIDSNPPHTNRSGRTRYCIKWEGARKKQLLKIYFETSPEFENHAERMYERWIEIFPKLAYLPPHYLENSALRLINQIPKLSAEIEKRGIQSHEETHLITLKGTPWPANINYELVKVWFDSNPRQRGHAKRLHVLWSLRQPDYANISLLNLEARARRLINNNPKLGGPRPRKYVRWTKHLDDDLVRLGKKFSLEKSDQKKEFLALWDEAHPELSHIGRKSIFVRLKKLGDEFHRLGLVVDEQDNNTLHKPPGKFIKWPLAINRDLEKLWHDCKPQIKGHSLRMYERWKVMHPDYAKIACNNLAARARRLILKNSKIPASRTDEGIKEDVSSAIAKQEQDNTESSGELRKHRDLPSTSENDHF